MEFQSLFYHIFYSYVLRINLYQCNKSTIIPNLHKKLLWKNWTILGIVDPHHGVVNFALVTKEKEIKWKKGKRGATPRVCMSEWRQHSRNYEAMRLYFVPSARGEISIRPSRHGREYKVLTPPYKSTTTTTITNTTITLTHFQRVLQEHTTSRLEFRSPYVSPLTLTAQTACKAVVGQQFQRYLVYFLFPVSFWLSRAIRNYQGIV